MQAYIRLSAFCEVEDTKIPRFPAATPGGKMRIVKLNAWHTVELEDVPAKGLEFCTDYSELSVDLPLSHTSGRKV